MEVMKVMDGLEDQLVKELDKIVKKGDTITPGDVKAATDAMCLLLKVKKFQNGDMMDEDDYSEMRGSYARGRNSRTGRYMSMDRDRGYSSHSMKDRAIDALERLYANAASAHEEDFLQRMINTIRAD